MMTITFGVSGEQGSFSEEAAMKYLQNHGIQATLSYLIDMEGVLSAIELQHIKLGIFPIVNLQGGLVKPALKAMGKYVFDPIDELWLEINQCMLVLPGTKKNQIERIVSHPQAFAQCKRYLDHECHEAILQEWINTASAAKDLASGLFSSSTAVIAPKRCALLYGLDVLAHNIQDVAPNYTAFIIVKHLILE